MNIILLALFILSLLALSLLVLGINISERAFKIIVLAIICVLEAYELGWFQSLAR